jgi:hypothetical protein
LKSELTGLSLIPTFFLMVGSDLSKFRILALASLAL